MPSSQLIPLLVPSMAELSGFAGGVFATAALILLGGLITRGSVAIEVRLLIGWGVACLILTFWGVSVPLSLRWPAWALVAASFASLTVARCRPSGADLAAVTRLVLIALPLILIALSVRPALPDTFLNLLPNAAYLVDHGTLPDSDKVSTISIFPALPYNQQIEVLLASLLTGALPAGGLVQFNIFVQLAFALLLARLVSAEARWETPGWGALAAGIALTTLANPGFMPKVALASMGEPTTEVTLAVAAWFGVRALGAMAEGGSGRRDLMIMSAVLLAFINIRQSNVALFGGLAGALALLALLDRKVPTLIAWSRLAVALTPAALLYGAWRLYVLSHFQEGELKLLPPSAWLSDAVPEILASMGAIILHRSMLFVCLFAAGPIAFVLWRRRREWSEASRALAVLVLVFLAFNAFLVFAYVAHFGEADGREAHSYFRYNSHLSLLMMLALTLAGRELYRGRSLGRWPRLGLWAPRVAVALALAAPIVFLKKVRFDLAQPQPVLWALSKSFAPRLNDGDRVAVLAPGDNGTLLLNLRGYLALTEPRRSGLDLVLLSDAGPAALDAVSASGIGKAIVTCAARVGIPSAEPEAVLLERGGGVGTTPSYVLPRGWSVTLRQPYSLTVGKDWMAQFPTEPFCRNGRS